MGCVLCVVCCVRVRVCVCVSCLSSWFYVCCVCRGCCVLVCTCAVCFDCIHCVIGRSAVFLSFLLAYDCVLRCLVFCVLIALLCCFAFFFLCCVAMCSCCV